MITERLGSLALKYGRMAEHRHHRRTAALCYATAWRLLPGSATIRRAATTLRPRNAADVPHLGYVALGTTGTCNASCAHCPTGKPSTAASPRGTMPMALFAKIIDGIDAEGVRVAHGINFGLFGDGLVDPLVIERARYLRAKLPDIMFAVNTNGAAFNAARHAALDEHVSMVALHCESLDPETFGTLMAPLRLRNVLPRYEQVLAAFPGKVRVSVPVSRANLGELETIRAWFLDRGAMEVIFDPLSSRCAENRSVFDALALAPVRIRCGASLAIDLIVDCDGKVISCCQDFSRLEPIGDLAAESFADTMRGLARREFVRRMVDGEHDTLATCSRCYGDMRTPDFPFDQRERIAAAA